MLSIFPIIPMLIIGIIAFKIFNQSVLTSVILGIVASVVWMQIRQNRE